jgi:hypothetical protein
MPVEANTFQSKLILHQIIWDFKAHQIQQREEGQIAKITVRIVTYKDTILSKQSNSN